MSKFDPRLPVDERFDRSYSVEPNSGCWLWVAAVSSQKAGGRPKIVNSKKPVSAYRYSYERFVGPIPVGKIICHKCNVSICVNPDHLYAGTPKDNAQDAVRAGTNFFVANQEAVQSARRNFLRKRGFKRQATGRKSKLSECQWVEIERRIGAGEAGDALGREFGINGNSLRRMLVRRKYRASLKMERGA